MQAGEGEPIAPVHFAGGDSLSSTTPGCAGTLEQAVTLPLVTRSLAQGLVVAGQLAQVPDRHTEPALGAAQEFVPQRPSVGG